jgi:nitrogen fixation protein NifX
MRRVAIGSKDGVFITEHFAQTKEFLIYEVNDTGEYTLVETRKNDFTNAGKQGAGINIIAELLSDVNVVFVSRIGPEAIAALQQKGINAVELTMTIDKALKAYAKRGNLLASAFSINTPYREHGHGH